MSKIPSPQDIVNSYETIQGNRFRSRLLEGLSDYILDFMRATLTTESVPRASAKMEDQVRREFYEAGWKISNDHLYWYITPRVKPT